MNLYGEILKEILKEILLKEKMEVLFPNLKISPNEITNMEFYKALQKIKTIIEDDSPDDKECFMKIENIVAIFEDLGSDGGNRHDF